MSNAIAQSITLPVSKVILRNRIVKAATTEHMADPNTNLPNRKLCNVYKLWSEGGGLGLLITGNVQVDRRYMEGTRNVAAEQVDMENPASLEEWKKWAAACRSNGTLAIVQLSHGGRQTPYSVNTCSLAPSPIKLKVKAGGNISPFTQPKEASIEEIEDIVHRFVTAAKLCHLAGFDGVQVHAAHGYLLSSFLSPAINLRSDAYGGDEIKRSQLLLQICQAIRKALPSEFILAVKLNTADFQKGGLDEAESVRISERLVLEGGIDLLEYSGGTYEFAAMMQEEITPILQTQELLKEQHQETATPSSGQNPLADMKESTRKREAFFLDYLDQAVPRLRAMNKQVVIMLTGGWRHASSMHNQLQQGNVDLIGLARPLCVEPNFPLRLLAWSPPEAGVKVEEVCALPYTVSLSSSVSWMLPKDMRDTINAQLQSTWHVAQMHRLAYGLSVDLHHGTVMDWIAGTLRMFVDTKKKQYTIIRLMYDIGCYLVVVGLVFHTIKELYEYEKIKQKQ